ncbi:MAG: MBL fold metallo-hydrolase [Erysipelotrichaceae bacterium]|nr:MBL fold metallo-hydrolase [Erysipelotrichaceae bacterium]
MKITVLVDNNTLIDRYYLGEPALSFLLETGGRTILFDTGYSDVLIRNAGMMGIDLSKVDTIVLSHGHNDHTGGLRYLKDHLKQDVDLICHPDANAFKQYEGLEVGTPVDLESLPENFHLRYTSDSLWITQKLLYLGEIRRTVQPLRKLEEDSLFDDTALAYVDDGRLSVITGCSHSGICNILSQAMELTGVNEMDTVIGGFHLLDNEIQTEELCDYLKSVKVKRLIPCHCTDLKAKIMLSRIADVGETGVSDVIEL